MTGIATAAEPGGSNPPRPLQEKSSLIDIPLHRGRRHYLAPAFAKADRYEIGIVCSRTQCHLVVILEKSTHFTGFKMNWVSSSLGHFEKAAQRAGGRTRNGTGAEEISWSKIAAAACVMRHHLCGGPVKSTGINLRQNFGL